MSKKSYTIDIEQVERNGELETRPYLKKDVRFSRFPVLLVHPDYHGNHQQLLEYVAKVLNEYEEKGTTS